MSTAHSCAARHVEVRFQACAGPGSFVFPCDELGHVDLDAFAMQDKNDYLFARAMVGRNFFPPAMCCPLV
ncbi:MAG: hypothetical protein IV097_09300 [Burkholderiaceae bacterium]|nr:hypothetical protein [Burkholderiaceae bacterium]